MELASLAEQGLRIYFTGFLFAGINIVGANILSAVESVQWAFLSSMSRGFIAILTCACLLSFLFGMNGVWLAFPCAELMTMLLTLTGIKKFNRWHLKNSVLCYHLIETVTNEYKCAGACVTGWEEDESSTVPDLGNANGGKQGIEVCVFGQFPEGAFFCFIGKCVLWNIMIIETSIRMHCKSSRCRGDVSVSWKSWKCVCATHEQEQNHILQKK